MPEAPSHAPQLIVPYLYYHEVEDALRWLEKAFGFRERAKETIRTPSGVVVHSAMDHGDALFMLGKPSGDYRNPKQLEMQTQNMYVYVDDVDAHFERAKAAGAKLLTEGIEDAFYGDRRYGTEDLEGHHWYFAHKVTEIPAEDWKPTAEDLDGHG
jgi:uncharacterized glyoxalase superfamily protein PhnB